MLGYLRAGRKVQALNGVVVTTRPGITRDTRPVKLGYQTNGDAPLLSLLPGDEVLTLHPMGEAYDRFWFRGYS